jgi:hypothetical protein
MFMLEVTGFAVPAEADGARVRSVVLVSRRRFGPSLTFGCVWHYERQLTYSGECMYQ